MARAISRVETVLIVLVIIAILLSGATLVYLIGLPSGVADLSSKIDDLSTTLGGRLEAMEEALKPIKIGAVVPLSAPGAYASGIEMRMAMLMALDEINAAGGVLGRSLALIVEDSGGLPAKGTAAMEKLITADEVAGIVGEFHSAVAKAEIEVAHQYEVPFIVSEAWADAITAKGYREVFRIAPANTYFYVRLAQFFIEKGFKNVVMIAEETDWGLDIRRIFTDTMTAAGVKVTSTTADIATIEFRPTLNSFKVMTPAPDLLIDAFTGTGGYLIISQAYEIGLAPTKTCALFGVSTSILYPELWTTAGGAAKYVITKTGSIPGLALSTKTAPFINAFEARYGRKPSFAAMEAYDSIYVLAEAIKRAGTPTRANITAALEAFVDKPYTGTLGDIYFSNETTPAYMYHQWPGIKAFLIQYTEVNQDWTKAAIIYPAELKTSELLWPP